MEGLAIAIHYAGLDQVDHAIADQFAMNSEVLMVDEKLEDRLRYGADAGLNRGAIGDQVGDLGGNGAMNFADFRARIFGQRVGSLNEGIDATHNPEFTMLELYAAYWDVRDMMDFNERLMAHLARSVHGQESFVYLVQDGHAHLQRVTTGVVSGEVTQVTGIQPGAVVANSSFEKLRDGSTIAVAPPTTQASNEWGTSP